MNLPVVTRVSPVPSGITTQRRMQPAPSAPTSSATTPRPLGAPSTIARALAVWCAGSALSFPYFFVLFGPVFYFFPVMFFVHFLHLIVLMHHSVSKNASVRPQLESLSLSKTKAAVLWFTPSMLWRNLRKRSRTCGATRWTT
jgi:hypothetical protein